MVRPPAYRHPAPKGHVDAEAIASATTSSPSSAAILAAAADLKQPVFSWKAFGQDLVKALIASPDALAALEMQVGLEERFAEVRKELDQASAPKAISAPRPPVAQKEEAEAVEEPAAAARPAEQPRLAVARPPRPPAVRAAPLLMRWSEPRVVEVVSPPAPQPAAPTPVAPAASSQEIDLLAGYQPHLDDEDEDDDRIGDVQDDDLDPSYRDPSYRAADPMLTLEGEPGAVLLGGEAGPIECSWGNPLRIGLSRDDKPLTPARGVIRPLMPSSSVGQP